MAHKESSQGAPLPALHGVSRRPALCGLRAGRRALNIYPAYPQAARGADKYIFAGKPCAARLALHGYLSAPDGGAEI